MKCPKIFLVLLKRELRENLLIEIKSSTYEDLRNCFMNYNWVRNIRPEGSIDNHHSDDWGNG